MSFCPKQNMTAAMLTHCFFSFSHCPSTPNIGFTEQKALESAQGTQLPLQREFSWRHKCVLEVRGKSLKKGDTGEERRVLVGKRLQGDEGTGRGMMMEWKNSCLKHR